MLVHNGFESGVDASDIGKGLGLEGELSGVHFVEPQQDSLMGSMTFNSWLSGGDNDDIDPNLETRGESAHILMLVSSFILAHINESIDYRSRSFLIVARMCTWL